MLCPRPIEVIPADNYKLLITFDNGERRIFDVSPYICGDWFGRLRNKDEFNSVRIANKHVEWRGGQDIAPHELYEYSIPFTVK